MSSGSIVRTFRPSFVTSSFPSVNKHTASEEIQRIHNTERCFCVRKCGDCQGPSGVWDILYKQWLCNHPWAKQGYHLSLARMTRERRSSHSPLADTLQIQPRVPRTDKFCIQGETEPLFSRIKLTFQHKTSMWLTCSFSSSFLAQTRNSHITVFDSRPKWLI